MITRQTSSELMLKAELMLHGSGRARGKTKGHLRGNRDEKGGSNFFVLAERFQDALTLPMLTLTAPC